MALRVGAQKVIFQDYNAEVLEKATKPVIDLNFADTPLDSNSYRLIPGTWEAMT